MKQRDSNNLHSEQRDELLRLEALIQEGRLGDARNVLRSFLSVQAGTAAAGDSIGDVLAILARQPPKHPLSAIALIRCLVIDGLVPKSNPNNNIVRHVVSLCEGALPDIMDYLRIDSRAQNYEKFEVWSGCHGRISAILSPLSSPYGDFQTLLNAERDIIGCLRHSIIRKYSEPFGLSEVRAAIESVFGVLRKVSSLSPTLLRDVAECNRVLLSARADSTIGNTFLRQEFLTPFLVTCATLLSQFLESLRGRFAANIAWGGASGLELQKRYPLHEPAREIQIAIPLRNSGPGMAMDVRITVSNTSNDVALGGETIMLGNVLPGHFSVTLDAMVVSPCLGFQELLSVEWGEIGSATRNSALFEFKVIAQSKMVNWQELEYTTPYSTEVAEGDDFVGREDKVGGLAAKLLRKPMESFYITGQKRVGKTSLALAAAHFAKVKSLGGTLDYHYVLWGRVAHPDPIIALRALGESIEAFIADAFPSGLGVTRGGDYAGSLADLVKLSDGALRAAPERKFVIIFDEFDEIHQELFLQGNLAETFFGNLRALSRCKNICLVLVGGENMPFIMERQGQKLNNFSRVNLSYFSRVSEWADFQLLVRHPVRDTLDWHDDAIAEVFNFTNGNPYFANIVCAGVFRSAVAERDADVTASEVRRATEAEVSVLDANAFAHLWQDGVPKAAGEREPDILRRMRVLVALARCLRQRRTPTASNIIDHRTSTNLSEAEVLAVLNDFVRREVLRAEDKEYRFGLPIFQLWLVDVGVNQLIADALSEELANAALAQENAALVRSEEVVTLSGQWATYRGKHIGTDEIRAWYQQVDSLRDQRILFELLKRTRVFSETLVRERLKGAHAMIRGDFPEFVIRRRGDRRRDIVLTYVDGEGKSGASYASLYAEENAIAADCLIPPGDFRKGIEKHIKNNGAVKGLVIMDDIAATGNSLSENLRVFLEEFGDLLASVVVRATTLVATESAQEVILKNVQRVGQMDVNFRTCEILPKQLFAFPEGVTVWAMGEEARARALCLDLGSKIYRQNPLGYGGLGLLVVFPTTVPNNSLPILHSYSRPGSEGTWRPLFERVVN